MTPAPRWPRYAAAAFGLLWYLQIGGGPTLNPLNTAWLMAGDWRQHWLGFLFFQREPWSFPLGNLPSLLYPVGTNIGLTDSNPLLAILMKPLAGFLPAEYQLIGLWLAACFMLQGYMGAALSSTVTKEPADQMLGGFLIALSPVLITRVGHDTLCAHFILIGLLYLGLRHYASENQARSAAWWAAAAAVLAACVHPYLAAMTWVLALAVFVRLWRSGLVTLVRTAVGIAVTTAGLLGAWAVIGYFARTPDGESGFGVYVANLLTFVDPRTYPGSSRLLPALTDVPEQWEGFGFLGLGGLVSAAIGLVVLVRRRPALPRGAWAPVAACAALALLAFSSHVMIGERELLNLEWLFGPVMPLVKGFRSSGRFIWPLHYLILAFGVWGLTRIVRHGRPALTTLLLALAVIVQASDLDVNREWVPPSKERPVSTAPFALAAGHYEHMALAPMQVLGVCGDPYQEDYVYEFMRLAHRLKLTFNSGVFARLDRKRIRAVCDSQNQAVDAGTLDSRTIYIASEDEATRFKASGAACGRWDGHWICVARNSNERFRTYIETGRDTGK